MARPLQSGLFLMSICAARIRIQITIAGAVASLILAASPARAQDPLWPDAPWRAFVTGRLGQGFFPTSLASGDMDGDGDLDVLVGQSWGGGGGGVGVSVLASRGDGTYMPPVYYPLPSGQAVGEVALADFDAYGDRDAFATIRGSTDNQAKLLVWRNAGDGTLAPPVEFATGQGPVGLAVADFTGDGKPDAATTNYNFNARTVSFLVHNGQAGAGAAFLPGGGNYCPTAHVTRAQMSVFLAVTFGLTLYGL